MNYTFYLTEKCNLNCKYCFEKNKGNNELTFSDIKNIIDMEIKKKNPRCQITFFGRRTTFKKRFNLRNRRIHR